MPLLRLNPPSFIERAQDKEPHLHAVGGRKSLSVNCNAMHVRTLPWKVMSLIKVLARMPKELNVNHMDKEGLEYPLC